jgi:hypothetical protein
VTDPPPERLQNSRVISNGYEIREDEISGLEFAYTGSIPAVVSNSSEQSLASSMGGAMYGLGKGSKFEV